MRRLRLGSSVHTSWLKKPFGQNIATLSEFINTYAGRATGKKKMEIEERTLCTSRSIPSLCCCAPFLMDWICFQKRHHNNVNLHELDLTGADYLHRRVLCVSSSFSSRVSIFTLLLFTFKHKISLLSIKLKTRNWNWHLVTHDEMLMKWRPFLSVSFPFPFMLFNRKSEGRISIEYFWNFCHVNSNGDTHKKKKQRRETNFSLWFLWSDKMKVWGLRNSLLDARCSKHTLSENEKKREVDYRIIREREREEKKDGKRFEKCV